MLSIQTIALQIEEKQIVKFPLEPKLALGLLIAKEYGCLEAFTLILSMVENRSPIIQKELNRDVIFSKNLNYFFRSGLDELSSDLKTTFDSLGICKRCIFFTSGL